MSLLIQGGMAFLGSKFEQKDILIEDGRIAKVGNALKGDEVITAAGLLVLPGLIDPHVHFREPGDTYKEDFATGSRAAIAGGFTTVMDMPNNAIPTTTKARLEEKVKLAKEKAICDVLFHFGGTDSNFDEVKRADPGSLKLYLGQTTGGLVLKNPSSLEKHLRNFPKEKPIVLHACDHSEGEEENLGKTYATIENALSLAKKTNSTIHLAHASTGKEIQLSLRYPRCTVEVAPHHLFLSRDALEKLGPYGKVYPPLRTEQKRIMLWSALDRADCIATDHAPHTIEDKERGAAGFPGLETSLALMLEGVERGLLDRIWVAQRMTQNPARIFNIKGKGRLEKGYAGDVAIVDPKKKWKIEGSMLETKCKWTPFDGMEVRGKVHTVVKGGKILFEKFQFVA
ncbi:dihydroorotase family protein [Candidatus Micrarchaeota archaeon]|nr:dihydroorotase family protein [Candidatus Micrarchaeota archaeon]